MSSSLAGHENVLLVYQHDILCSFHEMVGINIIWQGFFFLVFFFFSFFSSLIPAEGAVSLQEGVQ